MKIASIDVGLKRIGIAYSPDEKTVIPQKPVFRKNRKQASSEIREFLKEYDIDILVVGLPKDGSSSQEMQRRIRHFVQLIDFDKEIKFVDEYGTSIQAQEISKGIFKHKKDGKLDSLSAKIIMESFLQTR
jgi:putative Holliday junction resolvase